MSTNSTLGYLDEFGQFRGTTIHWDGMLVGHAANELVRENGRDWLVAWIEAGIVGGGYSSMTTDDKPFNEIGEPEPITIGTYFDARHLEYGWILTDEGVQRIETYINQKTFREIAFDECWLHSMLSMEPGGKLVTHRIIDETERFARARYSESSGILTYILGRLNRLRRG